MKAAFVVCALLVAMASATPVNVVDQPAYGEQVGVVQQPQQGVIDRVDPGYYRNPQPQIYNIDPGFYQPGNSYAPGGNYSPGGIIANPDPAFYQPGAGAVPGGGLYPDTGFVQVAPGSSAQPEFIIPNPDPTFNHGGNGPVYQNKPYYNKYGNDLARGGK